MWDLGVSSVETSYGLDFQLTCEVRSVHTLRDSWVFTIFSHHFRVEYGKQLDKQETEDQHAGMWEPRFCSFVWTFSWSLRDSNEEKRSEFVFYADFKQRWSILSRKKSSHQVCLYIYWAVNISLLVQFTAFYSKTNLSILIFSAT